MKTPFVLLSITSVFASFYMALLIIMFTNIDTKLAWEMALIQFYGSILGILFMAGAIKGKQHLNKTRK